MACAVLAQPANAQAADVTLLVSPISLTERADSTTVTVTSARVGSDTAGAITVTLGLPAAYTPLLTPNTKLATKDTDYTTTFSTNTITIADGSASASVTFDIDPTYDTGSEGDETIIMTGSASGLTVSPTELIITDGPYLSFPKFIYGHLYYPAASVDITVPEAIQKANTTSTVTYALVKTAPSTDPFNLAFDAATRKLTGTIPAQATIPTTGSTVRYTISATDDAGFTETTIVSVSAVRDICSATAAETGWKTKITATSGTDYDNIVANCNILLAAKDTLRGTAGGSLNWATATDMRSWDGVCFKSEGASNGKTACTDTDVTSDGDRIKYLFFHGRDLKGTIPPILGNLAGSNLTFLALGDDWRGSPASTRNQLTGPIPPELGNLSSMTVLALSKNKLTGTIPRELTSNSSLLHLYASSTGSSGLTGSIPREFGNLRIRAMNLHSNNLNGPIPWQLGQNLELQVLNFHSNNLSGSIPWQLGSFGKMQHFYLYDNDMSGPIPWQLGNLGVTEEREIAKMRLDLDQNRLTGSIPPQLGNISKLLRLSLNDNQLTGAIPAELGRLAQLQYLYLNDNQLTGNIPAEWGTTGSTLPELLRLVLNNNQLSGSIPTALGSLAKLQWLDLDNNQLSGQIPSALGSLSTLTRLTLNANQLTGQIPSALSLSTLTDFSFDYNAVGNSTLCLPAALQTWYDGLTSTDAGEVRCAFAYPDSPTLTPGSDRITARWASAPTLTLADSSVNSYEVQAIPTSGGQWQPVPGPTTAEWTATLTGLTPGQRYTVRYRARAPHSAADRFFASPWVQMDPVTLSSSTTGGTDTTGGTGGGGATSTDRHGNTPATATAVSVESQ